MLSHISTLIAVQKQTGLTVLQEGSWFHSLAENLPQLVWAADRDGKKTFCSRRYLDYTGADDLDSMDRSWSEFVHPNDREATISAWTLSLASGMPYTAEYRLRRSDGAFRFVKAQALPTYDEDGRIDGWLGMSKDINEERIAEKGRETDAKLLAVRRLASSLAHEINNPLESVTNALFLALKDHKIDATTRLYLQTADAELQRLSHIANHSLRFHKQLKTPAKTQLRHIVEDALSAYRSRLESAELSVRTEYRDSAELLCHADDLSQAMASLIRNCIDATRPGGQLCIRVRNARSWSSKDHSHVRITVADSGEGIPFESKGRIFDPFFTTKGATHTGLALWLAEQIFRKHGGKVCFRTSAAGPNRGTVFVVTLPFNGISRV